jgi:hypothetical protein
MFFRRERPKVKTFPERMEGLRKAGFSVNSGPGGAERASRGDFAIDLAEQNGMVRAGGRAGILLHGQIAHLVDGGYQKFFRTPDGTQKPALAAELRGLHDFEEDLKEALGEDSYYNESLGTVSTYYLYDRVQDRDRGVPKRVWE